MRRGGVTAQASWTVKSGYCPRTLPRRGDPVVTADGSRVRQGGIRVGVRTRGTRGNVDGGGGCETPARFANAHGRPGSRLQVREGRTDPREVSVRGAGGLPARRCITWATGTSHATGTDMPS